MKRRQFVHTGVAATLLSPVAALAQADKWGASQGYPTGWQGGFSRDAAYRVGNYSGGYETMVQVRRIGVGPTATSLVSGKVDLAPRLSLAPYLDRWPVTGLLIVRHGVILHESYRFARTASMRMASWSMAKSVTSLLLGICIDRGLVRSMDDTAETYVPQLKGTLHGGCTLRNLANMCSGSAGDHDRDGATIYPKGLLNRDSSVQRLVAGWNARRDEQGRLFRYNELCALTIGMVVRQVTGRSLSEFASEALWRPMGAEDEATWMVDSERNEFNCVGFGARLRDWARLGMLVAGRGELAGRRVVSERWIGELTQWTEGDRAVRHGLAGKGVLAGYKFFMWHLKADGSRPAFVGHHGQRVYIDMPTGTVLAQTAVDHEGGWERELAGLFDIATRMSA